MVYYAKNSEKKVFHKVLIHQLKRLFDEEDETSVEDYLRAKLDRIQSQDSVVAKEEILALLLSFMNDVSSTYEQFNKSLLLKTRSIAQSEGELIDANQRLVKNDRDINNSVVRLKESVKKLLEKKDDEELNFEHYDLEELTNLIQNLVDKNNEAARKLKKKNKKLKLQREQLERSNKDITDGIEYAKGIQDSILPDSNLLKSQFKDSFILNLPKEIVSGDFFWIHSVAGKVVIAVADCTGHGVPGAFTSIISTMLLNEITNNTKDLLPQQILNILNQRVHQLFSRDRFLPTSHDGLDIAICVIDFEKDLLQFSGAGRPMLLVRKDDSSLLKGNAHSIGGIIMDDSGYKTHEISLEDGDMIYLFSDGFADQFGEDGKQKFSSRLFYDSLKNMAHLEGSKQQQLLLDAHLHWRSTQKQIDDILVVGFRYQI